MTSNFTEEFRTVDLLIKSKAITCGVDAFALSLIKAERQIRKLFTNLIFQYPSFSESDVSGLRKVLFENTNIYFKDFISGIKALYPRSIKDLIGPEYADLLKNLLSAIKYRNKIFHGQLTNKELTHKDFVKIINEIKQWCEKLANEAQEEFGYDGFGRNSFQKNTLPIWKKYKIPVSNLNDYRNFINFRMTNTQI